MYGKRGSYPRLLTTYDYEEGSPAKVRTSPTTVTRWWRNASGADEQVTATNHYDDLGRLLVATDEESRSTAYRYDGLGRVTQVDEGYTGTFAADRETIYDCCGVSRQSWKKDASWLYTHYETDRMGRTTDVSVPSSVPDSAAPLVHYAYNLLGQTEEVTSYKESDVARTTSYTYNRLGQTTEIVHPYDTTEEDRLASEKFDYYESGALKWKQERDDTGSLSKTYFEYDDLGRRTGTDYAYDGTFDADVSFEYEGGSDLVMTVHEAGGLGDTVYAYDDLGRLKTYEPPKPGGFASWYKLEYEYNTLGQKTQMTLTTPSGAKKVTKYLYFRDGSLKDVRWPTSTWPPTIMTQHTYFKNGPRSLMAYGQFGLGIMSAKPRCSQRCRLYEGGARGYGECLSHGVVPEPAIHPWGPTVPGPFTGTRARESNQSIFRHLRPLDLGCFDRGARTGPDRGFGEVGFIERRGTTERTPIPMR